MRALLKHPLVKDDHDLDDPDSVKVHRTLIREKPFLREFYREVYRFFEEECRGLPDGVLLELGSGGGFVKEHIPRMVTSDVMPIEGVDRVVDGLALPYADGSVAGIFMLDVFHHINDAPRFLREVDRVLAPGGKLVMFEPAYTPWARVIFRYLHHEPFHPERKEWELPPGGPMSIANTALPWIVMERDRELMEKSFPRLRRTRFEPCSPMLYLLSGGVSMRQLLPSFTLSSIMFAERMLAPLNRLVGVFARIVVQKAR